MYEYTILVVATLFAEVAHDSVSALFSRVQPTVNHPTSHCVVRVHSVTRNWRLVVISTNNMID